MCTHRLCTDGMTGGTHQARSCSPLIKKRLPDALLYDEPDVSEVAVGACILCPIQADVVDAQGHRRRQLLVVYVDNTVHVGHIPLLTTSLEDGETQKREGSRVCV